MLYGFLSTVLFFCILPFWLIIGIFKPKLLFGMREKTGFFKAPKVISPIIFYGVSVGEVLAMENLIKKTKQTFPNQSIVVMTGTKTGQDIAKKKLSDFTDFITYFPLDFPIFINRMLKKLKPKAVFIMETELWPNFANITNKKNIPTYIINARISDRTFNSYKKLKFIFKPILNRYTSIFAQSRQDMEKFLSLGANPKTVKVMGNLKFDIKTPNLEGFDIIHNHPTIIAGSTHTGEDEVILNSYLELKKDIEDLKLIIAPRHPERNESVYKLAQNTKLKIGRRSNKDNLDELDIMLLDTMGELGKMYSICDVAFIAGSFNKTGGHNPLEATIFSKPVISGPCVHNFKDIYSILCYENAAKIVNTKDELTLNLKLLLTDKTEYNEMTKACEKVFEENKGALRFVIEVLQSIV